MPAALPFGVLLQEVPSPDKGRESRHTDTPDKYCINHKKIQNMATHIKKGLEYFSLESTHFYGLPLKRIRRKYKADGIAVYILLLCEIYSREGYYIRVTDDLVFDLAEDLGFTDEYVRNIIEECCKADVFNRYLYQQHAVLTSHDIQFSYYFTCYKMRRTRVLIDANLSLLSDTDLEQLKMELSTEFEDGTSLLKSSAKRKLQQQPVQVCPQNVTSETLRKKETKENILIPKSLLRDSGEGTSEADGGCTLRMDVPAGGEAEAVEEKKLKLAEKDTTILPDPHTPCPRGEGRNYTGLVDNLLRFRLEVKDINAILRLSNFGEVGDPVWQAVYDINNSGGRIKQPGKYIYSVINKCRQTSKKTFAL